MNIIIDNEHSNFNLKLKLKFDPKKNDNKSMACFITIIIQ